MIKDLAAGPLHNIRVYSGYYVNGFKFHVAHRDSNAITYNSGVCVKGSNNNTSSQFDYYGILDEIIEVEYPALPIKRLVMFKCLWYDPTPRTGTRVHSNYNLVEVNATKKFKKFEPFIFAVQASQVFYTAYPTKRRSNEWLAVCQIKSRSTIEMPNTIQSTQNHEAFQNEEVERHSIDSQIQLIPQLLVDVNLNYEELDDGYISSSEELEYSDSDTININDSDDDTD